MGAMEILMTALALAALFGAIWLLNAADRPHRAKMTQAERDEEDDFLRTW